MRAMSGRTWTLVAVVLASGIVFLDSTVVNVALSAMGRELPATLVATLEGQSYVVYGYLLTLSALLILAGALADVYGRRRMLLIGLAGFGASSVLCGLAPSMELLIAFRLVQGAFGAVLVPTSLAIVSATFEGEERGRALRDLGGRVRRHDVARAPARRFPGGCHQLAGRLPDQRPARSRRAVRGLCPRCRESQSRGEGTRSTGLVPRSSPSRSVAWRSARSAARSASGRTRSPGWRSASAPWRASPRHH